MGNDLKDADFINSSLVLDDFIGSSTDPHHIHEATERYNQYLNTVRQGVLNRKVVNDDLKKHGFDLDFAEFWGKEIPLAVLDVLEKHLIKESMPDFEMGILARCFAQQSAHPYWQAVRRKFEDVKTLPDSSGFKSGLAIALGQMCYTKEQIAELYTLIENSAYGEVRLLMLQKVKASKLQIFQELFERLVKTDPVMRAEILSWTSYWKTRNPALLEMYNPQQIE